MAWWNSPKPRLLMYNTWVSSARRRPCTCPVNIVNGNYLAPEKRDLHVGSTYYRQEWVSWFKFGGLSWRHRIAKCRNIGISSWYRTAAGVACCGLAKRRPNNRFFSLECRNLPLIKCILENCPPRYLFPRSIAFPEILLLDGTIALIVHICRTNIGRFEPNICQRDNSHVAQLLAWDCMIAISISCNIQLLNHTQLLITSLVPQKH